MPHYVYIVSDTPLTLWGLSSRERLRRLFTRLGSFIFLDALDALPPDASVLLLRGDFLYDERILKRLIHEEQTLLQVPVKSQHISVAASVPASLAPQASRLLSYPSDSPRLPNVHTVQLHEWSAGFQEQLRKFDPPYVLPITADNQRALEEHLYSGSYKGVTDLITKWAWPIPAKWVVRVCVNLGIVPNVVTTVSVVLTVIAGVCFAQGAFGSGLVAGWIMTFLDTVDGKLARVTVTSSKIGHILDHGLDTIHPPLWYIAWGMGLAAFTPPTPWLSLFNIFMIIVSAYIAGRLCESVFKFRLGQFGLFCWRPVDSLNRLITARRNPNLILLTGSLCMGRPDLGFLAVAAWTVLSTAFLYLRLALAFRAKAISGQPLRPWLADIGTYVHSESFVARIFTRPPFTSIMTSPE